MIISRSLLLSSEFLKSVDSWLFKKDINSVAPCYCLGSLLDQCLNPANVVEFMNLSWDPEIIALHSTWVFNTHGDVSRLKPEEDRWALPSDLEDETWCLIRCFERGDILPSGELYAELEKRVQQPPFEVSTRNDLKELRIIVDAKSFIDFDDEHRVGSKPDALITSIENLSRVIEHLLANPVHSSNDERDAWMYQRRAERWTLKQIMAELSKLGYDSIATEKGVSNAIDRYADRNFKPRIRSGRGPKRKQ